MKLKDKIYEEARENNKSALELLEKRRQENLSRVTGLKPPTRTTCETIEIAISRLPEKEKRNRYSIAGVVSELLMKRHGDQEENKDRDVKLARSRVSTTGDLLLAIDQYIRTH